MSTALAFASIGALSARLRNGEISPTGLLEIFVERIARLDGISKAFISLDLERARDRAHAITVGADVGPLTGIPYACKDLFDVQGVATTGGSSVLADNIAGADADTIARMHAAGAIFLGKNNLHEFAYGATGENRVFGTSPNPYDRSRLAGGSSSGSAAAVGFGLCPAALGTDTGGSVRAPAALSGLVGFKPTFGRISTDGVIPFSWSMDHVGTLTRCAADAALLFPVLAEDPRPLPEIDLRELTIGIPEAFFFDRCDAEILGAVDALKQFLQAEGARIRSVAMPSVTHSRTVALTVQMPEALSYHNRYLDAHGELYSRDFRAGLALGQSLLAEHYIRARRFTESYRRELARVFADVDLLLTPACPTIAPPIGATEVRIGGIAEPVGNAITRFTSFFNLTGNPAITLPSGLHSAGLPMGAQMIGAHFADEFLLAAARRIESARGFEMPPPRLE